MNTPKNIFLKSLYGLGFAIFLAVLVYTRADKSKSEFSKVNGKLISIGKSSLLAPRQDTVKYLYLLIDDYPKKFEIFIGKDFGDFKPKFEKLDNLRPNDDVTIYFDENFQTKDDPINRLTYFIDREEEPIFIKGDWEKNASLFLIGLTIFILIILVFLKLKGKIT